MKKNSLNFPNFLTLSRLILSPLVLPILLFYCLPLHFVYVNYFLALLFVLFSLTDFFDGYLARKYKQETSLGSILDPMADKFLFYSVFIALVASGKIFFYWAIIFIGREFFIMGLRIIALEKGFSISVSAWGKLKTIAQTIYVTLVIGNPFYVQDCPLSLLNHLETVMLIISLFLSLWSAYRYYKMFVQEFYTKNLAL